MNDKIAFTVPVDENGNRIDTQQRAPAENIIAPSSRPVDINTYMPQTIQKPAFYETPLFSGGVLFIILLLLFIGGLTLRNKIKKK